MTEASNAHEVFRRIYDTHLRAVLAYARRRTSADEADDVVADTFLVAWRRLDDVPPGEEALPWLYGVARRVLSDHRRAAQRRGRLTDRLAAQRVKSEHSDEPYPSDDAEIVKAALARLKPAEQEVLRLATWEELTNIEIGQALGCSTNAAAIRLHRARRQLARTLGEIDRKVQRLEQGGDR